MIARVGRWSFTHRWTIVALWVVAIFLVGALPSAAGSAFSDEMKIPDSESATGFTVIEDNFGDASSFLSGQVVFVADQGVDDPEVAAAMQAYLDDVAARPEVTELRSPYAPEGA